MLSIPEECGSQEKCSTAEQAPDKSHVHIASQWDVSPLRMAAMPGDLAACLARDSRGVVLGAGQLREGCAQVLLLVAVAHLRGCAAEAIQAVSLQMHALPFTLTIIGVPISTCRSNPVFGAIQLITGHRSPQAAPSMAKA